jgi:hypothetical protein
MKIALILALLSSVGCAHTKTQPSAQAPVAPSPVTAPHMAKPVSNTSKISCTKDADVRTLEVAQKGAGCSLDYEKFGKISSVSSSAVGLKHCEESKAKIRTKLEQAGFSCK